MPKISVEREQQRRQQILEAAMGCFARQGYHATSMEDIVQASGLSMGAIYTYFPSKEELFTALADSHNEQAFEFLRELFEQPGPLDAKLSQAVDYFFDQLADELAPLGRISLEFWGEALKSEALGARHRQRCDRLREFYEWLLTEAQRRGDLRPEVDVAAATDLLMALNDGIMLHHLSGVLAVPRAALKAAYIGLMNHGLGRESTEPFVPPATTTSARASKTHVPTPNRGRAAARVG